MERRIKQLETLRLIAIFIIFMGHCNFMSYYAYGDYWIHNPFMSVDYFFLLSGFGLYYAYSNRPISKNGIKFAVEKIKSIYPLYIISMVCMVPYSIIMDMKDAPLKKAFCKALIKLLGGGTLLQAGIGSSYVSRALNAPCWFLSCLFMIYMICPALLKVTKKIKMIRYHVIAILAAILFLVIVSIFTLSIESRLNYINELFYASPYVRWLYVFVGMQIAAVVRKRAFAAEHVNVAEIICTICAVSWFICRNKVVTTPTILRLTDVVLCASCLFVFSIGHGKISQLLADDKYLFVGKLSAYIFIIHFVVISYIDLLFENNRFVLGQWTGAFELLIIISLVYVISRSIYYMRKIQFSGADSL